MVEKKNKKKKKTAMPTAVWFSLKNSLHCKSEPSDVHEPTAQKPPGAILTRKPARSGCSRSLSNLKDVVIHGSKRHPDQPPNCSPRSIGSSDFLNPITHDVIFSTSKCELKICGGGFPGFSGCDGGGAPSPGTPFGSFRTFATPPRKREGFGNSNSPISTTSKRSSFNDLNFSNVCHKCGDYFPRLDALESHHLSRHAVSELAEGDSSRKIVEIICRSSKPDSPNTVRIDRVLKVHNTARSLSRFEDYREAVKIRAGKLPKKHPRCLADGNELLRFYGTSLTCSLGSHGSSGLCMSDGCSMCRIIRHGFESRGLGVFTASTSGRAYESIPENGDERDQGQMEVRKALVVCRVIAGRVHRPVESVAEIGSGLAGFDSLAGKVGLYSNIEELFLLNPKALLPCFVVICKR